MVGAHCRVPSLDQQEPKSKQHGGKVPCHAQTCMQQDMSGSLLVPATQADSKSCAHLSVFLHGPCELPGDLNIHFLATL